MCGQIATTLVGVCNITNPIADFSIYGIKSLPEDQYYVSREKLQYDAVDVSIHQFKGYFVFLCQWGKIRHAQIIHLFLKSKRRN